jgi:hypothetical protein
MLSFLRSQGESSESKTVCSGFIYNIYLQYLESKAAQLLAFPQDAGRILPDSLCPFCLEIASCSGLCPFWKAVIKSIEAKLWIDFALRAV